jgi:starvation-inducible DNA-binding protein
MGSSKQVLHTSRIDIPANARSKIVEILNQTLASSLDLKTQVKQAHWNVKGMDFYQLHELFDEMATELEELIDLFAERITALGGTALGTARIAAQTSEIPEYPLDILDGKAHVTALADRYAPYAKIVRDGITSTDELGDADTADLYTEVSRAIDKRLWFLEAHLQSEAPVSSANGSVPESKPTNGKKSKSKSK